MSHHFEADGLRIAYDDVGEGEPILLMHGFAADRRLNWKATGWYELLAGAGYRVIAADAPGHGQSDKPTDPAAYRPAGIAGDTIRLMDHLGLRRAHVFGYSMGGRNAAWLMARHPGRFDSGIIGGSAAAGGGSGSPPARRSTDASMASRDGSRHPTGMRSGSPAPGVPRCASCRCNPKDDAR